MERLPKNKDEIENLPEKSPEQKKKEFAIRQSLLRQGHSRELANAFMGYEIEDIPFIYKSRPREVVQGNSGRPMRSHLWIGTSDEIHNLVGEWNDQIPEVLVQWWGDTKLDVEGEPMSVRRLEAHQLKDDSFVFLAYTKVSEMGGFDGSLSRVEYHVPNERFRPGGGSRERMSYNVYSLKNNTPEEYSDVPGGRFLGKENTKERWTLQTEGRSGVSGTTILNGFSQMVNFSMGEIQPVKEEPDKAFRYTPLPDDSAVKLLPKEKQAVVESRETQLQVIKHTFTEEQRARTLELMSLLAPRVLERLQGRQDFYGIISGAVDGILNHPEKIDILEQKLDNYTRRQRFRLAQAVARSIREGHFSSWLEKIDPDSEKGLIKDVFTENARSILDWWIRVAPEDEDFDEWLSRAEHTFKALEEGQRVNPSREFVKCYEGVEYAFVERFVEYIGQQYFGRSLE